MLRSYLPPLTITCLPGIAFHACSSCVLLHILSVETNMVQRFMQVGGARHASVAVRDVKPA
jgi:hypothetical protein